MRQLTFALLLTLAGCASSGTQVKDSALTQFQKGVTTEADVERALGPPTATSSSSNGVRVTVYAGAHAQAKAASFIPVVGISAGGATAHSSMVSFRFDQAGKLIDYTSTHSSVDASNH
jgi:hypothetical protein